MGALQGHNYILTYIFLNGNKGHTVTSTVYTFTIKRARIHKHQHVIDSYDIQRNMYSIYKMASSQQLISTDYQSEMGFNLPEGASNVDNHISQFKKHTLKYS